MGNDVWLTITVITIIIHGRAWAESVVWVRKANGRIMGGGLSPYKASPKGVSEG